MTNKRIFLAAALALAIASPALATGNGGGGSGSASAGAVGATGAQNSTGAASATAILGITRNSAVSGQVSRTEGIAGGEVRTTPGGVVALADQSGVSSTDGYSRTRGASLGIAGGVQAGQGSGIAGGLQAGQAEGRLGSVRR